MGLSRDMRGEQWDITTVRRDPLRFLVRFTQLDLDRLSKGEWWDLQWEVKEFTIEPRVFGPLPVSFQAEDIGDYANDDKRGLYRSLQERLRAIVEDYVSRPDAQSDDLYPLLDIERIVDGDTAGEVYVDIQTGHSQVPGSVLMIFHAPLQWVAALQAHFVLQAEEGNRLKKCPQCGTYFLRVRRQKFCSGRCTNKASMTKYLAKQENLQKHREASHRTYAKNKRASLGANVRIRRQPRKGR